MKSITVLRRFVQIVSFVILMYGGFLFRSHLDTPLGKITPGGISTTKFERSRLLWVSGKESVVDLYLPALACRFTAKGGFFKSCSVHLLSENLTWRTPLKIVIPHLLFVVLMMLIFGRLWCGWICPMGAMMDFLTWLRKLFAWPRRMLSAQWERFLFYTRHLLLWGSLLISLLISLPMFGTGANDALFLIYCQFCPARLLYPGFGLVNPCWTDKTNSITMALTYVGWACLAIFFISFLIPRFWCRICAIGVFNGYFNRGALVTLEKNCQKCSSCGTCARNCPIDIDDIYVAKQGVVVTAPECQLCLTCLEDCPEKGALELKILGKKIVSS